MQWGKVERINNTFSPTTYSLFLHFSIYLFVVILSIALKGVEIYSEIPLLLVISSVFFLIEKSAAHLQDPFSNRPSDTPVTSIARTIEINIKQLLDEKEIPQPLQPGKFFYTLIIKTKVRLAKAPKSVNGVSNQYTPNGNSCINN